jgi:hypothetical protein
VKFGIRGKFVEIWRVDFARAYAFLLHSLYLYVVRSRNLFEANLIAEKRKWQLMVAGSCNYPFVRPCFEYCR